MTDSRRIEANPGFDAWLAGFRPRALAEGIAPEVYDRATRGVGYNAAVIDRDRSQAEFTRSVGDYLASAVSDTRIANGRAALARHAAVLDRIAARYGVEKEIVVAVWGMESAYGTRRGDTPTIEALATLAYDGRRGAFFEGQLIAALKIVQDGNVTPRAMVGSWAGAMGHTQFIPTSYLAYAVDFGGDGRRDVWSDDPTDALASTAAYLAQAGWVRGQPWGVEVTLPEGFDHGLTGRGTTRAPADWAALGVRTADGGALPDHGAASILTPAGADGPALMVFGNFRAILRYNNADSYAIAVGHLADRIGGGAPFRARWPETRAMRAEELGELQSRLALAGFDPGSTDGRFGPRTEAALRGWQRATGRRPDGYPDPALLGAQDLPPIA